MKRIKILVACGTVINCSTILLNMISEICQREGIPADFMHCSVPEIPAYAEQADIVCPANAYKVKLPIPVMNMVPLLTGIGKEEREAELVKKLKELAEMDEAGEREEA